jgi:hypothetical protein
MVSLISDAKAMKPWCEPQEVNKTPALAGFP